MRLSMASHTIEQPTTATGEPMSRPDNLNPYIICGGKTGRAVIFGYVAGEPRAGEVVDIYGARMVIYWPRECGGLLGLASKGPKGGARITAPAGRVSDTARQVISVPEESALLFLGWKSA